MGPPIFMNVPIMKGNIDCPRVEDRTNVDVVGVSLSARISKSIMCKCMQFIEEGSQIVNPIKA